jgi:hypothetical protein
MASIGAENADDGMRVRYKREIVQDHEAIGARVAVNYRTKMSLVNAGRVEERQYILTFFFH